MNSAERELITKYEHILRMEFMRMYPRRGYMLDNVLDTVHGTPWYQRNPKEYRKIDTTFSSYGVPTYNFILKVSQNPSIINNITVSDVYTLYYNEIKGTESHPISQIMLTKALKSVGFYQCSMHRNGKHIRVWKHDETEGE